jgi:hypothetical protein
MSRGEINVDPVHDEFFKTQDLADALVREAIQNSLDARRGHSTVRVRFRLATGGHALARETAAKYLNGLDPHVDLRQFAAMPFLLFEDSGTRGLVGHPGEDPELDEGGGERNDFYYFWRNVGRSGKSELDRGRWGLGKAVFSVSSRIHTMFGLTQRAGDGRRLLLGQTVLKTHVIDGRRFAPYGFFANSGRDDFPHAIEDPAVTRRFIDDFGLQRDEPGLSIVIPFHREDDLRFESIVASAIRQYFYPITRGDLAVTVEENGRTETITARTIEREASDPNLAKLCALARWSMVLPDSEWTTVAEPPPGSAPKWRDDSIAAGQIEILRQRFENGDRLAFRVHVPVRRKRSRAATSHFNVVLEKDETLRRGEHQFIRRGITIPEVRSPREKPVRALLIADDEALSTFLGDAENPAHSDWSERNDKIRGLYEQGPWTLRYVKNAIAQIAAALSRPATGRAPDLLADIFSIAVPGDHDAVAAGRAKGDVNRGETTVRDIGTTASANSLRITAIDGGFTIQGIGSDHNTGARCVAEVAYRTRSGDPFRKYSPFDFAIGRGGVTLKGDGAEVHAARENRVEFQPLRADFQLTVTGFDRRRDLVVRISRKDDDAPEAELH